VTVSGILPTSVLAKATVVPECASLADGAGAAWVLLENSKAMRGVPRPSTTSQPCLSQNAPLLRGRCPATALLLNSAHKASFPILGLFQTSACNNPYPSQYFNRGFNQL
jgi:hypothetical protein